MTRVLVVEDEKDLSDYLKDLFLENGYSVQTVHRGVAALKIAKESCPDLVILDLGLPDISGESVCEELKKQYAYLPIIILTAKDTTQEIVHGLGLGADDYITKPFVGEELLARVKARLRRYTQDKIKIADLTLDTESLEVRRGNKIISLSPKEFRLLEYLIMNKGRVMTREMILNRIWSYSPDIETRVVDVYVGYLRKKIDYGFTKKLIHSIRGFGYVIKE